VLLLCARGQTQSVQRLLLLPPLPLPLPSQQEWRE
jgi:hypothetical protein